MINKMFLIDKIIQLFILHDMVYSVYIGLSLLKYIRLIVSIFFTYTAILIVCCHAKRLLSNRGREFYIGFLPPPLNNQGVFLTYTSTSLNPIEVQTFLDQGPIIGPRLVMRNLSASVPLNSISSRLIFDQMNSVHVYHSDDSTDVLSVYASIMISSGGWRTASYLALPSLEILTAEYEYYALSTSSFYNFLKSGFFLVAFKDDTHISIHSPSNQSFIVNPSLVLSKSKTKLISGDGGMDLTGTRIVSDKPLAVISGHEGGSVPMNGTWESMAQQIPPTHLWGQEFMIVPFEGHSWGQIIKLVSSTDDTEIVYNCNNSIKQTTEKAGHYHEFFVPSNVYCYIEANNSVLVGQFPYSPEENKDTDTTMVLVASVDQYSNSFNFWTPDMHSNYISITVSTEYYDNNSILYDGEPLETMWRPISDSTNRTVGYGCALNISAGRHEILHSNPNGCLFVMAYGFSRDTYRSYSYGYPVGLTFNSSRGMLSLLNVHNFC